MSKDTITYEDAKAAEELRSELKDIDGITLVKVVRNDDSNTASAFLEVELCGRYYGYGMKFRNCCDDITMYAPEFRGWFHNIKERVTSLGEKA
jgi:hypothetical protein